MALAARCLASFGMCINAFLQQEHAKKDSSYLQHVREEYTRTEDDAKAYIKACSARASSQWRAMSDAEKAVCAHLLNGDQREADHFFGGG